MKPAKLALRRSRGRDRMTSPFQTGAAPLEGAGPEDVTVSNRVNYLELGSILAARRGAARRGAIRARLSVHKSSQAPRRAAPRRAA